MLIGTTRYICVPCDCKTTSSNRLCWKILLTVCAWAYGQVPDDILGCFDAGVITLKYKICKEKALSVQLIKDNESN